MQCAAREKIHRAKARHPWRGKKASAGCHVSRVFCEKRDPTNACPSRFSTSPLDGIIDEDEDEPSDLLPLRRRHPLLDGARVEPFGYLREKDLDSRADQIDGYDPGFRRTINRERRGMQSSTHDDG